MSCRSSDTTIIPKAAVFLDRDGTIIEEVGYLDNIGQLKLIPGAARAIELLNKAGIPVIMITNQSGIARGIFLNLWLNDYTNGSMNSWSWNRHTLTPFITAPITQRKELHLTAAHVIAASQTRE